MNKHLILYVIGSLILLSGLLATTNAFSAGTITDTGAMVAAEKLYVNGHYAEAARIYEQVLADGVEDSRLAYNLGNAFFQMGDMNQAQYYYQWAAQLDPRDADTRHNLALVNAEVTTSPLSTSPVARLANVTRSWLTQNELAVLALGLWFTFGLLLFVWRSGHKGRFQPLLRLATGFTLILVILTVTALGARAMIPSPAGPFPEYVAPIAAISFPEM